MKWLQPPAVGIVLLLALTLLGWRTLDDYGISWDEAIQRTHGRVSLDYAFDKLGIDAVALEPQYALESYPWAHYGMLYQLTSSLLERRLGWSDDPFAYYRLRHALNFFLYLIALICFYRMLRLRWPARSWFPLLGTAMLVFSPRLYGHAFFNPKDHVLLVGYVIASYTLLRYLRRPTLSALLMHALATALALNTRLPALMIVVVTLGALGWEQIERGRGSWRPTRHLVLYLLASFLLTIPFFPYLWEDTWSRLIAAFSEMSAFEWGGHNLLFGNRIPATDVPAYYIPVWIAITTPLVFFLLILYGLVATVVRLGKNVRSRRPWRDYREQFDLVQFALAVGPVLAVILLDSTLYNGWRHLHFVYPALTCLAVTAVAGLQKRYRWLIYGALALEFLLTAVAMVRYHPHQYVYFNEVISGEPLGARFDMDYWGTGFREAFVTLARSVPPGETRTVFCEEWPCVDNLAALPPPLRSRLTHTTDSLRADYLATHFIYRDFKAASNREGTYSAPVLELRPAGHLTIGIYRIDPPPP